MRVKRKSVEDAILRAAEQEFIENGYQKATVSKIARRAGISPANVYVYFQSKLEVVLAVYAPWFRSQILDLEQDVDRQPERGMKLTKLVEGLWIKIPHDEDSLTRTLMQALATAKPNERYSPELLMWAEQKIAVILRRALGRDREPEEKFLPLAHMIMFAFDGVSLRHNLHQPLNRETCMIPTFVQMLLSLADAPKVSTPNPAA
mgnify:CR=1 FL=1